MLKTRYYIAFLWCMLTSTVMAQYIPVSSSYLPLYEFLEELKADNHLSLDHFSGPLSEKEIALSLKELVRNSSLSYRVKNEIGFYQREFQLAIERNRPDENDIDFFRRGNTSLSFHPLGYFTGNGQNSFKLRPIGGIEWTLNNNDHSLYYHKGIHLSGNMSGFAYYGKIHDQTHSQQYTQARYLNNLSNFSQSAAFEDMLSGGISFSNNWLMLGLFRDQLHLGNSVTAPLLLSHRSPAYNHLKLKLNPAKWFSYTFALGTSGQIEQDYHDLPNSESNALSGQKKFSLNNFTFKPASSFGITLGQLTVFSQEMESWTNNLPLNVYQEKTGFNPLFYYHLHFSTIPHLSLSFTQFFDNLAYERLADPELKNHFGYNAGAILSNWPIPNVIFRTEYSYISPYALESGEPSFQNSSYPLGWYLEDHSDRFYFSATAKPVHNLQVIISYEKTRKGDYSTLDLEKPYVFNSFESLQWETKVLGFQFRHQTSYYTQLFAGIYQIEQTGNNTNYRIAPFLRNRSYSFNIGFSVGY